MVVEVIKMTDELVQRHLDQVRSHHSREAELHLAFQELLTDLELGFLLASHADHLLVSGGVLVA